APAYTAPVTALLVYELVALLRLYLPPTANDAIFIDFELTRRAKGHNLIADFDRQARKIVGIAVGPFKGHLFKTRVFLGFAHVFFARVHISAHGAVNTVFGDEDAPFEP